MLMNTKVRLAMLASIAIVVAAIVIPRKLEKDRNTIRVDDGQMGEFALSSDNSDVGVQYAARRISIIAGQNLNYRWIELSWTLTNHLDFRTAQLWACYDRRDGSLFVHSNGNYRFRNVSGACLELWSNQRLFADDFAEGACSGKVRG